MSYIKCENISYSIKSSEVDKIIDNVSFEVEKGEFVIILGKSGSGKTTLLNIMVGLIQPTWGNVIINGNDLTKMTDDEKTYWRRYCFGYIFQNYGLFEILNVYDNIALSLDLESLYSSHAKKYFSKEKTKKQINYKEVNEVMDKLKIRHLWNKFPHELSGGQQQRVSIARILVKKPEIVFADEPTGALDSETSEKVMESLKAMNENGSTIVMITHNQNFIKYATKVINISDGKILSIEKINKSDEKLIKFNSEEDYGIGK